MSIKNLHTLTTQTFNSPLGQITAVADHEGILILSFENYQKLPYTLHKLSLTLKAPIQEKPSPVTDSIIEELNAYFAGKLKEFKTPLKPTGTDFQKRAWSALRTIPYGDVKSYSQQAQLLGQPTAFRAVANANGANPIIIAIPCHRIIASDGGLGGYNCGIERKRWLLEHEKSVMQKADEHS